jgi:hypothetical protein
LAAETFPEAVIERLMKSKPKMERFRLKNKHINKAALQLANYEKNEGRKRRKRHGKKKCGQESTTKTNADALVNNSLNKEGLQAAEKRKNTGMCIIQATDPVVTNECVLQERADIDKNSEDGQKNSKETEENNSDNSVAVPCLKRKSDLSLRKFENMDTGLQQLKVQRKESPTALKVGKGEKSEMSKKKSVEGMQRHSLSNLTSKLSTLARRKSVGGNWKVSDVAETTLKVSASIRHCDLKTNFIAHHQHYHRSSLLYL